MHMSSRWRRSCASHHSCAQLYRLKDELTDSSLTYPDYYVKAFHGYELGNLAWPPALECEPATEVIAARLYNDSTLSPAESAAKERRSYIQAIKVRSTGKASPHSMQQGAHSSRNVCVLLTAFMHAQRTCLVGQLKHVSTASRCRTT